MIPPTASAMPTGRKPTEIDKRPPYMIRLYVSRPKWSVPSQCSASGGCRRLRRLCAFGSWVRSSAANTAARIMMPGRAAQTSVRRLRTKRRIAVEVRRGEGGAAAASAIAHPELRIEVGVKDVNEQVDDCIGKCKYEDHTMHDREILGADGVHCQPPDARPGEDRFR